MAVAVVDRAGTILGVYRRSQADARTPDIAVSLARTTGYFSNDQAPLSSRTVRFISGIHFPPGIANQPNAALYGVENINRGCDLDVRGRRDLQLPHRPSALAGRDVRRRRQHRPALSSLRYARLRGGWPDTRRERTADLQPGDHDREGGPPGQRTTAPKRRSTPAGSRSTAACKLIGGVGVAGVSRDRAEFAALVAAAANGRGITTAIDFPQPLPVPGAIFIDGLRLPFTEAAADRRPAGSSPGDFLQGTLIVTPRNGRQAPEGYLIGPRASSQPGGLTLAEVQHDREPGGGAGRGDAGAGAPAPRPAGELHHRDHRPGGRHPGRVPQRGFALRRGGRGPRQGAERVLLQHPRGLRGAAQLRERRAVRGLLVGAGAAGRTRLGAHEPDARASADSPSSRPASTKSARRRRGPGSTCSSTTRSIRARRDRAPAAAAIARSSTRTGSRGSPAARRSSRAASSSAASGSAATASSRTTW